MGWKLGLTADKVISIGTFDAHPGAVGAKIDENNLLRIMGTSTCNILVSPKAIIGSKGVKEIFVVKLMDPLLLI